jgi:hypothetical protein
MKMLKSGKKVLAGLARIGLSAVSLASVAATAHATNLVTNGDFEQLQVAGVSSEFGDRYSSQQVTGWTTSGYNYVFVPGTADRAGAVGEYGHLMLWGPNDGAANGLPETSPTGGNFIAMDGAYNVNAVSQMISGLTPGQAATVSFFWGGAQQFAYDGNTSEQLAVSLGGDTQYTAVLDNMNHGFTGWQQESMTFVPTSSSEMLSFLSVGTPAGEPPFALLDGVSVSDTPEPASWSLLVGSFAGFGIFAARRRALAKAAK